VSELTYAKVNGPPDDWDDIIVRDLASGEVLEAVIEVNTAEGWAVCYELPPGFNCAGDLRTRRITGTFALERLSK